MCFVVVVVVDETQAHAHAQCDESNDKIKCAQNVLEFEFVPVTKDGEKKKRVADDFFSFNSQSTLIVILHVFQFVRFRFESNKLNKSGDSLQCCSNLSINLCCDSAKIKMHLSLRSHCAIE